MGLILLAVLAFITVIALFIMRGASPLFRKLQKLLDRMSAVLLENITDGELLLNNVNIRNCSQRAAPMPRCTTANSHDLIKTEPRGFCRAALSLYKLLIWFSLHSPFIPQRWRDTES